MNRIVSAFRTTLSVALSVVLLGTLAGCGVDPTPGITDVPLPSEPRLEVGGVPHHDALAARDAVLAGNAQGLLAAPSLVPPGAPLPPFVEARLYAIVNVAMHDALNAIVPRFDRYADEGPMVRDAAIAAAVLTAAHDAIVGAAPGSQASIDAWYAAAIANEAGTDGLAAGIALGHRVAAAILARRAHDGTDGGGVAPYTPGATPGDYRFTFPFNTPGFDFFGTGGFADGSAWGTSVTPFVLSSASQFRAPRPYGALSNAAAVLTAQYTSDFNEVKALGCNTCASRTASQTEIARFWVESSPSAWNRIARTVADKRNLDAWDAARLLALLQMGEFDAYASNFESKYHYNFWRPVTAVALAGNDANPGTIPAAGWEVLAFPTPPVPDYPSGHASAGGAAAAIMEAVVQGHGGPFTTTSASLPGVTRTFATVSDAATENALSRIYVGYHFRHATDAGLTQGRAVGEFVAHSALRRRQRNH
ncbi:MAG: vanadium-dependent haloperoxidase [Gemmatimonadota bacterium]